MQLGIGRWTGSMAFIVFLATLAGASRAAGQAPVASGVDLYTQRPRVVVTTDIGNKPRDQMSLVRFLLYLERVRPGRTRGNHVDLDEGQGAARRHPLRTRRLRDGPAEPPEARGG